MLHTPPLPHTHTHLELYRIMTHFAEMSEIRKTIELQRLVPSLACFEVLVWVMQLTREVRPASGLNMTKRHFEVCLNSQESELCPAVNLHQRHPLHHIFSACLHVYLTAGEDTPHKRLVNLTSKLPARAKHPERWEIYAALLISLYRLDKEEQMKGSLTASFLA